MLGLEIVREETLYSTAEWDGVRFNIKGISSEMLTKCRRISSHFLVHHMIDKALFNVYLPHAEMLTHSSLSLPLAYGTFRGVLSFLEAIFI